MSSKVALLLIPFLLFYGFQTKAVEKEEHAWQDEIIYYIMVDRFNNGDTKNDFKVNINDPLAYQGGDFKGVIDKLDYIKDLGFTTILLSPIYNNEEMGYHGNWIHDFYDVEEHFGTLEEFKRMVDEAHSRDMKVVLDLVVNHTGFNHPWLTDPAKANWFQERNDEHEALLPVLKLENPEVEEYVLNMAKWWITETDIDGYHVEEVNFVSHTFWDKLSNEVKSVKQDFFLMGDVWHNDPSIIAEYDETGIQSFLDYPRYEELTTTFSKPDQPLNDVQDIWEKSENLYDNPYLLGTFLDNSKTARFTRHIVENKQNPETRLKLALTYLYGSPGIPMIYYGTEIAMDGGETPDNHRMMEFRADKVIIDYIAKLATIRNTFPSLIYGDFIMLYEDQGMAIYKRSYRDEVTILAINNSSETKTATIDIDQIGEQYELRALLSDEIVRSDQTEFRITMDRETSNIFQLEERTGINWSFIGGIIGVWAFFGTFLYLVKKRSKRNQDPSEND